MPRPRTEIPKAIREKVLNEFNHRCAMCGKDRPHIHHIDDDNSNNAEANLIPLCPNHHLIDQHNPTESIDPRKLQIFRRFKDPTILSPKFEPLFKRMRFIFDIEDALFDRGRIEKAALELISFVHYLEMGGFYGQRLNELISPPSTGGFILSLNGSEEQRKEAIKQYDAEYRDKLLLNKDQMLTLITELLRFQRWSVEPSDID
jgi:hypothetical protein